MTIDTASIVWGLVFGTIGIAYFRYGRKHEKNVPLVCGIALMIYPYFIDSNLWLVLIGAALMITPYFIRR